MASRSVNSMSRELKFWTENEISSWYVSQESPKIEKSSPETSTFNEFDARGGF